MKRNCHFRLSKFYFTREKVKKNKNFSCRSAQLAGMLVEIRISSNNIDRNFAQRSAEE